MAYRILKKNEYSSGDYKIVHLRDDDKYAIMEWRNQQMDILRQKEKLTRESQTQYFSTVISRDFESDQPRQVLFSYMLRGELIGYGGFVHMNWQDLRSEVSFLLETERNKDIEGFKFEYGIFLRLMKDIAFNELGMNKLTTEAFDLRPYLIETLEANGFVLEGRLKSHNLINGVFVDSLLHACFAG
jgi:RimJ/RimL family protein N-acetyltransferase